MPAAIYLLQNEDALIAMRSTPSDSERLLQDLLAKYPDLLAGEQMNGENPHRWLLISREVPVPAEQGAGGRWAADHLFLDQDGVPTIVEVKRCSDSRIRREVVGQTLDYAANAVVYWPVEDIRARYEAASAGSVWAMGEFLGEEVDPEEFWQRVKINLQAGRVRMVFVADRIPPELRRIVEFLNLQMDPAEVLAIEVEQFVGSNDLRTLVPRIIGQTAEAQRRKRTRITVDPDQRIHLLVKENPYREGSRKAAMFDLLKEDMTVDEFLQKGGPIERVRTMVRFGRIALRK
jgi:hypothetical protein